MDVLVLCVLLLALAAFVALPLYRRVGDSDRASSAHERAAAPNEPTD